MSKAIEDFEFHLNQLEILLTKSISEVSPAIFLLNNNARTPIFMVEALCKLYKGLDEEIFGKLKERFKTLEDALGNLDYYNGFRDELKNNPEAVAWLQKKSDAAAADVNTILNNEKWIIKSFKRIRKAKKKINSFNWPKETKRIEYIQAFYKSSIKDIFVFYESANGTFTSLENQVHELRRRLRWLSIYPHALRGTIQLMNDDITDLQKYLTDAVLKSPFNTFPPAAQNQPTLNLNRTPFLALSWMIAELGTLKDEGLKYGLLNEISNSDSDENKAQLKSILQSASAVANEFFSKKVLERLV